MKKISTTLKPLVAAVALLAAGHALAQVTFYEGEGFRGRAFAAGRTVDNFANVRLQRSRLLCRRRSWPLGSLRGRRLQRPLRRPSTRQLRLAARHGPRQPHLVGAAGDRIPAAAVTNRGRRRRSPHARAELRIPPASQRAARFDVPVSSVRAVAARPSSAAGSSARPPSGATSTCRARIIGGVLGGILGHQLGGGSGKTVTTIGGAVGRRCARRERRPHADPATGRDVQRCENVRTTPRPRTTTSSTPSGASSTTSR